MSVDILSVDILSFDILSAHHEKLTVIRLVIYEDVLIWIGVKMEGVKLDIDEDVLIGIGVKMEVYQCAPWYARTQIYIVHL